MENYNEDIKNISTSNTKNFTDIDLIIRSLESVEDVNTKSRILKKIEGFIKPIKSEVEFLENKLNTKFKTLLSEKQYKKWMKFQTNKKEHIQPAIGVKRVLRYEKQTKTSSSWN